jgi:hypothetical protein
VVQTDGTRLPADYDAIPVNMLFHALFRKVDVYLNGRQITQSNELYPWKAGIETLLNFGRGAKETQLAGSIMYYKDLIGPQDVNDGMLQRRIRTNSSALFEMCGPLHVDLFFQPKYLLSGVSMRIVLNRSLPNFYLHSSLADPGAKIHIDQAILFVRRVKVSPSIELAHSKVLDKCNAIYPLHRTEMEIAPIPGGSRVFSKDGIFGGKVPSKLVMVVLTGDALNGGFADSPFRFVGANIRRVDITLDGEPVADTPISSDFRQGLYLRAYLNMFSALNKSYSDHDLDITFKDFRTTYSMFCFDLTSDSCGNTTDHFELERKGHLRIVLGLKEAASTYYVLFYGEFEGSLEITKSREILF